METAGDNILVSVILPAYNEAGNIPVLFEKIDKAFAQLETQGEAILIDDGSTDGTGDVAKSLQQRFGFVKVLTHRTNRGLTAALSTGIQAAKGEIIVFLPSDLQSDPEEDLPKLLAGFDDGNDVVVGWRQGRMERKKWGSKVYNFVSTLLFDVRVHDQNWIKAFRKSFAKELVMRSDWHRFLVAIAVAKGYKIGEVKTNWYPRTYGSSKFGISRIIISVLDMLVLKIQMLFLESPIRFFGGGGLLLSLAGFGIIGGMSVLKALFGVTITEAYYIRFFLVSVLLVLLGVCMLVMGILGELIISHIDRILLKIDDSEMKE
jgi:glycosyltransferase involved in cell wall biosynthesis